MSYWRSRLYESQGVAVGADATVVKNAVAIANAITKRNPQLPPIFTLRHLAHLASVDYGLLRLIICRALDPYRTFRIRKRLVSGERTRYRVICVPDPSLMRVQRWIVSNILTYESPHEASVAYSKDCRLVDAAAPHCASQWLIKLDVRNFFESITELSVYRTFLALNYQPLISFELARLCTRLGNVTALRSTGRWSSSADGRIRDYNSDRMGYLPQGAPTSPMLANLACVGFDKAIAALALENDAVYTRYADDISISSAHKSFGRARAASMIGQVYAVMAKYGLSPNTSKARVSPPGSRKIVQGLLVDGPKPRLQREYKATLRQHVYYLTNSRCGPAHHARMRQFASISGMRNYIYGLVAFASQIEPEFGAKCMASLNDVTWPI